MSFYDVTYIPRGDTKPLLGTVRVDELGPNQFCATHLGLWGCGKTASTPEGAIRLLVQDMATILKMEKAP